MKHLHPCLAVSIAVLALTSLSALSQMPSCHSMASKGAQVAPADLPVPQKLTGVGNLHFPISSKNPETQAWFDQGINLVYDFWDYEADRAFEQAIRTDPDCAICQWGLSQSLGSHNFEVAGYAHQALMQANALRKHADKRERLYIDEALAEEASSGEDNSSDQQTKILRQLVHKFPHDLVAQLMLSDALGDGYKDGKPNKGTQEKIEILQGILKQDPNNSAANHLWIHAVEPSPHPEQALASAALLASLAPASGHMTHMPGHIFYRTGDYERAQVSFDLSESVDEAYLKTQRIDPDNDWNYVHNLMYSIANLLELGQMNQAATVSSHLATARGSRATTAYPWSTRDSITRISLPLPIALRLGDWAGVQSLLAKSNPTELPGNLKTLASALAAFAAGMNDLAGKRFDSAQTHSTALDAQLWQITQQLEEQKAAAKKQPKTEAKPENKPQSIDPELAPMLSNLSIMSLELRGAILIASGKLPEAKPLFAQARRQEQELGYHEPPAFIRPAAEIEADLLLTAGQPKEAEAASQLALEDRPNSGFPLYGLARAAEDSRDNSKTQAAYRQFLTAWKTADPELPQVQHAQAWLTAHSTQTARIGEN